MRKLILLIVLSLLYATIANAATHSVTLSCTPGVGGGTVTGFNFYRSTASGSYTTAQNATPVATCAYVDTSGLVEGTKYFYVVRATGPGGESGNSNEVQATIPFQAPAPPALAPPVVN